MDDLIFDKRYELHHNYTSPKKQQQKYPRYSESLGLYGENLHTFALSSDPLLRYVGSLD
jgi:hypothetical protein